MTHHDEMSKKKTGMSSDVSRAGGMGGPEAGEETKEKGVGPHTMQTEAPTTATESKEGFAMAGSRGTETVTRGKGSQQGSQR
jgi:hypothetical protein